MRLLDLFSVFFWQTSLVQGLFLIWRGRLTSLDARTVALRHLSSSSIPSNSGYYRHYRGRLYSRSPLPSYVDVQGGLVVHVGTKMKYWMKENIRIATR